MSQDKKSSMSAEERTRRRASVGKSASEKMAKSEQLNFRLEEQSIKELQDIAFKKGMPVGTMIREWVLERLAKESHGNPDLTGKVFHLLKEFQTNLNCFMEQDFKNVGVYKDSPAPSRVSESVPTPGYFASASNLGPIPFSAQQNSGCNSSRLEHLKAWEHILNDEINWIRRQTEELS